LDAGHSGSKIKDGKISFFGKQELIKRWEMTNVNL